MNKPVNWIMKKFSCAHITKTIQNCSSKGCCKAAFKSKKVRIDFRNFTIRSMFCSTASEKMSLAPFQMQIEYGIENVSHIMIAHSINLNEILNDLPLIIS